MKFKSLKTTALLAVAGLGLLTPAVKAASFTQGDLLLGFYSTSGASATTPYLVDLGAASTYRDATSGFTLSLGNIGADLSSVFGANWKTRSDLYWGVFGTAALGGANGDIEDTLYAGRAEVTYGTQAGAYTPGSASTLAIPSNKITGVANLFASNNVTNSTNSSVAVIEDASFANDFAEFQTPTISFSFFNGALGNFASGTGATQLDLFRLVPGSAANRTSTYEGSFTINDSGVVSYSTTPLTPVPEPSTVFAAIGLVGLAAFRGRRRIAAHFAAK